jgi:hypothetical protein
VVDEGEEVRQVVVNSLRFVIGMDGKPTAVQIDIETWHKIVEALEDAEDIGVAREALAELKAAGCDPEKAGWLRLEDVAREWDEDAAV